MVLEEEGSIRAARGEDSRDIRRANTPAEGPAPPESILFIGACWFHVTKIKRTTEEEKKKKEEMHEQGRTTFQQCAKRPWKRPPGMEGGVLGRAVFRVCGMCTPLSQAQAMALGSSFARAAYSPLR